MPAQPHNVCLVGLGSIGVSFAALHLRHGTGTVTVFDTRPDLKEHIASILPGYLGTDADSPRLDRLLADGRLVVCSSLQEACKNADIVQEQGPEQLAFKRAIWPQIEQAAPQHAHLWSSTSGIAASLQNAAMADPARLLVVHPFNPPQTSQDEVAFARSYFAGLGSGHRPVVIKKELPGFVGNRLAYILFREAAYLVKEDVASVEDVDAIITASLGPRFAVQGLFNAYHMGGGTAGIRGFLGNLGTTIQEVWDTYEGMEMSETGWVEKVIAQTEEAYGVPTPADFGKRDRKLREVLETQK